MLINIQFSNINTVSLFLNADVDFDNVDFGRKFYKNDIIDKKNRNGKENNHVFDELLYKYNEMIWQLC